MKAKYLLTGLALAAASTSALAAERSSAQGIRYTYLEATHQIYSEGDLYRWELKGSYQIDDQFYVALEDSNLLNSRSVSAGLILPLQDTLHIYVQFGLGDSDDDMYPILEGGLRVAVSDQLELRGALRFEPEAYSAGPGPGTDDDSELSIGLEGLFHVNQRFSLTAGLVLPTEADGEVIRIGGRVHF